MTFADTIKKFREAKGLSQTEAAVLCDISIRAYQQWEKGGLVPHRFMQQGALSALGGPDQPPTSKSEKKAPPPSPVTAAAIERDIASEAKKATPTLITPPVLPQPIPISAPPPPFPNVITAANVASKISAVRPQAPAPMPPAPIPQPPKPPTYVPPYANELLASRAARDLKPWSTSRQRHDKP